MEEGFLPPSHRRRASPTLIDEHYPIEEACAEGDREAMGEEYRAVVDSGLNVQVDDAFIPFMYDIMVPRAPTEDWLAWVPTAQIDSLNYALEGHPAGEGPLPPLLGHLARPAHERRAPAHVLDLILQVNARRSCSRPPIRATSTSTRSGKTSTCPTAWCSPGRRSRTRTKVVEHPDLVAERIERIAHIVGAENVIAAATAASPRVTYHAPRAPEDPLGQARGPGRGRQDRIQEPGSRHRMSTVWTRPVPPGITAASSRTRWNAHGRARRGQGHHGEAELRELRDPFQLRRPTTTRRRRSSCRRPSRRSRRSSRIANERRGPAVDPRPGPQQRLRRPRPARERLDDRLAAQHEPGARDQRGAGLRGRGAGRALVRPLRGDQARAGTS